MCFRLAHDITIDSPSPTKSPEPPDSTSDDDGFLQILNDNKCCTDEDHSCPHLPRAAPPVPPVFPPSPEVEIEPTPLCGAPSPRHKPALRSATSSNTNSPKRKVDFQNSPTKLLSPKKSRSTNSSSVSQKNIVNNNQTHLTPTHKSLSLNSNNNNGTAGSNTSPFSSPRRARHVSVGEEIVDAFVRSCSSPICGSPRPKAKGSSLQTSPNGSLDSGDSVENDDEYEEDEINFDVGCSLEDDDGYEVDEVIEVDEILTVEVEEKLLKQTASVKSLESCKNEEESQSKANSETCSNSDVKEGNSKKEETSSVKDKDPASEVSDVDEIEEGEKGDSEKLDLEEEKDNSNVSQQQSVARRRRLLPEIPKSKKCEYQSYSPLSFVRVFSPSTLSSVLISF